MSQKKDKILFWIETYHLHFGYAKAISENYACEIYGLVVCNPIQKHFFKNQKLLHFEKTWYLRDHIDLTKIFSNYEKIKNLEKKFSIPLRKIILGDRFFYKYNNYYKFSDNQILSIVEQELEFYDKILDEIKPDFIIIRPPEFQDIELFYEVCKAKKIPILILASTRLGKRWTIAPKIDAPLKFNSSEKNEHRSFEDLQNYSKIYEQTHNAYLEDQKPKISHKLSVLKQLHSIFNSSNINSYRDLGKSPFSTLKVTAQILLKSYFRKTFLDKNAKDSVDLNQPYAYFPLHFEPERIILRQGENFADQICVIKNIAQALPIEMSLFVKEHPAMDVVGWRHIEFYKNILEIPKVELIHPVMSSDNLIKNSSLVISIASTASLDAAFHKKPSIIFSDLPFSNISSIFKVTNLEELSSVIQKALNTEVSLSELNNYVDTVESSSFDCDLVKLQVLSSTIFGHGGFLDGSEISESGMKEFLDKNHNIIEQIAFEHIKKIKSIKENSKNT